MTSEALNPAAGALINNPLWGALSGNVAALPQTGSLWGLWLFDEGGGTSVVDHSGNGYDLTLQNTYTWVPGGVSFPYSALDYASVGGPTLEGDALTIIGVVYRSTPTNGSVYPVVYSGNDETIWFAFGDWDTVTGNPLTFVASDGDPYAYVQTPGNLPMDTWMMITGRREPLEYSVWQNTAELVTGSAVDEGTAGPEQVHYIGRALGGTMAFCAIWTAALTDAEIAQVLAALKPGGIYDLSGRGVVLP